MSDTTTAKKLAENIDELSAHMSAALEVVVPDEKLVRAFGMGLAGAAEALDRIGSWDRDCARDEAFAKAIGEVASQMTLTGGGSILCDRLREIERALTNNRDEPDPWERPEAEAAPARASAVADDGVVPFPGPDGWEREDEEEPREEPEPRECGEELSRQTIEDVLDLPLGTETEMEL